MEVLKFFNVGEKVCIGMTGRKVFTIIGIQNTLPMFGGGQTLIISAGKQSREVSPNDIREASIKPVVKRRSKKTKREE